jgi:hypothetical protein
MLTEAAAGFLRGVERSVNLWDWMVSELVEIVGGIDIFAGRRSQSVAKDRVMTVEEVIARDPDLITRSASS